MARGRVRGLRVPGRRRIDGERVKATDRRVYLLATDTLPEPQPGDRIEIANEAFTVSLRDHPRRRHGAALRLPGRDVSGEFAIDVSRFGAKTGRQIGLAVRKIALDLFTRVIMRSPGRHRPLPGELADDGRGARHRHAGGVRQRASPAGRHRRSGRLHRRLGGPAGRHARTLGPDLWLANNLPYAVPLENGHSPQAPGGMVKLSMLEVPGIVASAAKASADEVRS